MRVQKRLSIEIRLKDRSRVIGISIMIISTYLLFGLGGSGLIAKLIVVLLRGILIAIDRF